VPPGSSAPPDASTNRSTTSPKIISCFDLIAVQEVNRNLRDFERLIRILGREWDYILTDTTEGQGGNGERMAFVYNRDKVFGPHDGVEHEQLLPYGTPEWQETYKHDRNTIESYNDFLKAGLETLDKPEKRKVRGRAAQQFIVTFLLMSANIRKIARFIGESRRAEPKIKRPRRRDTLGLSDYVRPNRGVKTPAAKKAAEKRAALKKAQTPLQT
jgi:hypothetical protein